MQRLPQHDSCPQLRSNKEIHDFRRKQMRNYYGGPVKSIKGFQSSMPEPRSIKERCRSPSVDPRLEALRQEMAERVNTQPIHKATRDEAPLFGTTILPGVKTTDAAGLAEEAPRTLARGKSTARSLMQPQDLARRLLPASQYKTLKNYAEQGVPTDCGKPWEPEVIAQALQAGPHTSATTPGGVELLWDDIQYQVDAGFVKVVTEEELFAEGIP